MANNKTHIICPAPTNQARPNTAPSLQKPHLGKQPPALSPDEAQPGPPPPSTPAFLKLPSRRTTRLFSPVSCPFLKPRREAKTGRAELSLLPGLLCPPPPPLARLLARPFRTKFLSFPNRSGRKRQSSCQPPPLHGSQRRREPPVQPSPTPA